MHPCRTALIGLLLFGFTRSQDPLEAVLLNTNLYAQGDIPDLRGDTPYWWMNKGSPFKRSYSSPNNYVAASSNNVVASNAYSQNSFLSGNSNSNDAIAYSATNQQIDITKNPYLNGKPFSAAASSDNAYAAPGYLPPNEVVRTISCDRGQGQVCVTKYLCRNGYVDSALTDGAKQVRLTSKFYHFFLTIIQIF